MYRVITWDNHDHPDMDAVVEAINYVSRDESLAFGAYADTQSDFYAYVVADDYEMDRAMATRIFKDSWLTAEAGVGEVYG
jgi:hypothetical protein